MSTATLNFQELLTEFVALEKERREHEDRLKIIQERVGQIQEPLLNHFADTGIQNARVGDLTAYVRMDRYCSKKSEASTEAICQVLRESGLGYMVSDGYNASSLKSKIKEYIDNEIEIPESLSSLLNIGEIPRLATRK